MATQIDGAAADGKHITINVTFTDLERSFVLELENSVLHHKEIAAARRRGRDRASHEGLLAVVPDAAGVAERPRLLRVRSTSTATGSRCFRC